MSTPASSIGAEADLSPPPSSDSFVYEYVGEVIGPTAFAKRMKDYATGGIRHFYFMALDREVVSQTLRTLYCGMSSRSCARS